MRDCHFVSAIGGPFPLTERETERAGTFFKRIVYFRKIHCCPYFEVLWDLLHRGLILSLTPKLWLYFFVIFIGAKTKMCGDKMVHFCWPI